ncbi:MAG: TolC family protein, partial [Planctomycetaceae bacterium]
PCVDPHEFVPGVPPGPPPPLTLSEYQALAPNDYWNLTLHEAIQAALVNSKVLRDLGATVLDAPANTETIHGPAIRETDPQFGIEGALAAFDADFSTSAFFENNDRALNNTFLGGGTRTLQQDLNVYQTQLRKQAATGTEFFLRSNVEYDSNNAPGNRFFSAYTSILEAEARQPLLQGAGVDYNRIAGPNAVPGVYNGVLIARINTDIELADFELALRDYISNVENAYWDLYFAYRDLDAKIDAREYALITWRKIYPQAKLGQLGGDLEARAREQYYAFDVEVQNALAGRLLEGTRTDNGSSGGTFRGTGGVLVAERRLRLLMGVPISDGRLIRPCDEPIMAHVLFSWEQIVEEALTRRGELIRQRAQVKR